MSIRVETRGGKTVIETDYHDPFGVAHKRIYEDVELLGAMRASGISRVEVNGITDTNDSLGLLKEEFDKQYQKTHSGKYFGW
jgi:hypothetical protein